MVQRFSLVQFFELVSPTGTIDVWFDQTLVYCWVNGISIPVIAEISIHYCPNIIEIWRDGKPIYGIHPATERVYLNALSGSNRGFLKKTDQFNLPLLHQQENGCDEF